MTQGLHEFQHAFAHALRTSAQEAPMAALTSQSGFTVYRNTVMKGCIDALAANYPAVARLVGDEWFRAAAAVFARANPPRRPMLVEYGEAFPDFLSNFEPAAELPYLSDVARLDRFWTETHIGADQTPLAAAALANLEADVLARTVLRPHMCARWKWFSDQPVFSLWRCNREEPSTDALATLVWCGEGVLLVRPHLTVEAIGMSAGGCAFLDACAAGAALSEAGLTAVEAEADIDLSMLMAQLLSAGAFSQIQQ